MKNFFKGWEERNESIHDGIKIFYGKQCKLKRFIENLGERTKSTTHLPPYVAIRVPLTILHMLYFPSCDYIY